MILIKTGSQFEYNGSESTRVYMRLENVESLIDVEIGWVDWFGADFSNLKLERVTFKRCDLTTADFSGCRLIDVEFIECTLTGVHYPNHLENTWTCTNCLSNLSSIPPWVKNIGR
jgi:uncharacterized protein YjbI with pentapeptide repeats